MKRLIIVLGCAVLCGAAHAEEDKQLPCMIRVQVEYIDALHGTVTEVMQSEVAKSGPKLHAHMRALVKAGKARIMETNILMTRPGQKATLESIHEFIYPEEYEPGDGLGWIPPAQQADGSDQLLFPVPLRPGTPPCFSTRNLGVTLEIEANVGRRDKIIDLRMAPEIVNLLRLETWLEHQDQWGDASLRKPIFESLRLDTGITLLRDEFAFVGLLTPTNTTGGLDTDRKIMLFVRATVVYIEDPDRSKP